MIVIFLLSRPSSVILVVLAQRNATEAAHPILILKRNFDLEYYESLSGSLSEFFDPYFLKITFHSSTVQCNRLRIQFRAGLKRIIEFKNHVLLAASLMNKAYMTAICT
jgi:hypothetical protein